MKMINEPSHIAIPWSQFPRNMSDGTRMWDAFKCTEKMRGYYVEIVIYLHIHIHTKRECGNIYIEKMIQRREKKTHTHSQAHISVCN